MNFLRKGTMPPAFRLDGKADIVIVQVEKISFENFNYKKILA